jgi:CheY-like chemotaxis protein
MLISQDPMSNFKYCRAGFMTDTAKTILIIEDEMQMRFYLMTLVKSLGMTPVMAADGNEGLAHLGRSLPDAVILDIMMPNKGGAAVYTAMMKSRHLRQIPIVFFSGVDKGAFLHYVRMLNTDNRNPVPDPKYYVAKDADPQYLKDILKRCLQQPPGESHGI